MEILHIWEMLTDELKLMLNQGLNSLKCTTIGSQREFCNLGCTNKSFTNSDTNFFPEIPQELKVEVWIQILHIKQQHIALLDFLFK